MQRLAIRLYLKLFNYVVHERRLAKDLPERFVHSHLACIISTGVLMWAYAIVASLYITNPLPGIVGIFASAIHLFSPLLFKRSNNYFMISNVYIGAGIVHQGTFAYFTGGFDSPILIWFGILPMLAGVNAGKKGAFTWAIITGLTVFVFFILKLTGFQFPNLISERGLFISQTLILFGWIFISTVVIWAFVLLVDKNAAKLELSYKKNQNLINILSHDIATPLMLIIAKLNKVLKTPLDEFQVSELNKVQNAADRINEITKSVRELHLSELDKREITLEEVDINSLVPELYDIYVDRIEKKNLKFKTFIDSNIKDFYSSRSLILHQILGNLLSNAIKFSPLNSEILLQVTNKGNLMIEFLIEDSGQGIPPEMRNDIFEAKFSKSLSGTGGEIGTGLGLPIVKSCVTRLGGTITFDSRTSLEGKSGTIFKITFPYNSFE